MTCEQAKAIMRAHPFVADATTAERCAVARHMQDCQECLEWVLVRDVGISTPEERQEYEAAMERDRNDPEAI